MTSGGFNAGGTLASRALEIRLTEQEAKICEVLDAVANRYQEKEGKPVQLRIAGGWVRDKVGLSHRNPSALPLTVLLLTRIYSSLAARSFVP